MWKGLPWVQARTSSVVHTRPAEGRALQPWASALPGRSSPSAAAVSHRLLFAGAPGPAPTGDQQPHPVLRGRKVTGPPSSGKEFLALQVCCFLKGSPGLALPHVCPSAQNTGLDQPPPKIQKAGVSRGQRGAE